MKTIGRIIAVAGLMLAGMSAGARDFYVEELNPAPMNAPIVPGQWHLGWAQCIAYAEQHDLPMLAVWSNLGCDHCYNLDQLFITDTFKKWQAESPKSKFVLCFMAGGERGYPDQQNSDGFNWAGGPWPGQSYYLSGFPFVALYWPSQGVNYHVSGDVFVGTYPIGDKDKEKYAAEIIAKIEARFKDFPLNKDSGVSFVVGAGKGMEIERGKTTYVDIPLARTNDFSFAETNVLKVTVNGVVAKTDTVVWAKLQEKTTKRLTVNSGWAVGTTVKLDLYDAAGKELKASSSIRVVAAQAVTASNPRWKGASKGEWTMDLTAAQKLGAKYTLVLFTGALWCPHCKGLERQVFASSAFKTFAADKALVALDNPHRSPDDNAELKIRSDKPNGAAPTLLRYDVGVADSASGLTASGASYMTRNMVDVNEAEEILQRNHTLGYQTWRLPDDFRTGYPSVLLLKGDRIVGRLAWTETGTKVDTDGQKVGVFDVTATMKRLQELVDLAEADATEEKNGHWSTTTLSVPAQSVTPLAGTLDANDTVDVIKFAFSGDARVKATFKGSASAPVTVKLVQEDGVGGVIESKPVSGDLRDGVSVSSAYEGSSVYAVIEADASAAGSPFSPFASGSSLRAYELSTAAVIIPGDDEKTREFAAGTRSVTIQLTAGKVYRIEGLADELGTDLLVAIKNTDHLYRASESCDLELPLPNTSGSHTVKCRVWETGVVGFAAAEMQVTEGPNDAASRLVTVTIPRTGGASGKVNGTVRLMAEESTIERSRIIWAGDAPVSWGDGDSHEEEISFILLNDEFYDPVQTVVFKLDLTADSVAGVAEGLDRITISVKDNDKVSVGRLAVIGSTPQFARQMTVVSAEGKEMSFTVRREGGAFGDVSACLEVRVGGVAVGRSQTKTWKDGQRQSDYVFSVTTPADADRAEVVIVPTGIKADTARGKVAVQIVGAGAPLFATDAVTVDATRFFVSDVQGVPLDDYEGEGWLGVEKVSGTTPSGMSVYYDDYSGQLVVDGTPTAPGEYTAVYQLYGFDEEGGFFRGGTVALNFTVGDTAKLAEIVPAAACSRQFASEMVFVPGEDGVSRLAGALSIALPANGRASAKYMSENGVVSYAAKGWGELDEAARTVSVRLSPTFGGCGLPRDMVATVAADGLVTVAFEDMNTGDDLRAEFGQTAWASGLSAADFQGMYTVQLPQLQPLGGACGDGFAVLKLTEDAADSGRVLYAGGLPNGRYFSGSAYLKPCGDAAALPVTYFCQDATKSSFAGALEIAPGLKKDTSGAKGWVKPVSGTVAWWSAVLIGASDMEAYGGRPDVSLHDCCMEVYQTVNLPFELVADASWRSGLYGKLGSFTSPWLVVGDHTIAVEVEKHGLRLAFNQETGVLSGTIQLPFEGADVSATFRGVVLPGWEDCGCGRPDVTVRASRPFASGSIWFDDAFDGMQRRNGCGFTVSQPKE